MPTLLENVMCSLTLSITLFHTFTLTKLYRVNFWPFTQGKLLVTLKPSKRFSLLLVDSFFQCSYRKQISYRDFERTQKNCKAISQQINFTENYVRLQKLMKCNDHFWLVTRLVATDYHHENLSKDKNLYVKNNKIIYIKIVKIIWYFIPC